MTEEPNTLVLRFPRSGIFKEDEKTIWVKVDDAIGFMEQLAKAFVNPHMAVVRMDEDE
jgi:hypothetical protein